MSIVAPSYALPLLVTAAFGAGVVDAIGGGGGLLTVPALLAVGLPVPLAIPTNKGQAVFGAVASAVSFGRRRGIDRDRALLAFACGALGAIGGAALLLTMKPEPLKPIVLAMLVFAGVLVAVPRKVEVKQRPIVHPRLVLVAIALLLGFYDGFFGPGVGSLLIIAFATFLGDSLTRASGNAKVVNLASNLAAFTIFTVLGKIQWGYALPMAVGNALGASVGARLALHRGDRFVRVVLLCAVGGVAVKLAFDVFR
jgi:uncharacterized membrane protein YfcA